MNKTLLTLSLISAPLLGFPQMRWVFNGTTPLTFMLNGGTQASPVYIEVNNPAANAITTIGTKASIVSENEFNMVKWDISNTTGTYVIPFGYGTAESLPLSLNIGTAGNAGGSILFSTWHTLADNVGFSPTDVTNMAAMYPGGQPSNADNSWNAVDRFWVMDASSYGTKPAANNIGFSYISSGGTPSEVAVPNVFAETTLLAQRFNPAANKGWGDWLGTGGTDVPAGLTGTVQTGIVAANNFYRSWTLSSSNSPLPIQLSYFTSECVEGAALIQWTSQSELNNAYYTVKKTNDDIHFETVGTLTGAGTSSLPNNYSITDNSPFAGTSYYLLYQTDFDGNSTLAGEIPFAGCQSQPITTLNAYNTTNYIEIQINAIASEDVTVSLINMLGQTIINENHPLALGSNEIRLNNLVSKGIYILSIKNNKINYTKKLVL